MSTRGIHAIKHHHRLCPVRRSMRATGIRSSGSIKIRARNTATPPGAVRSIVVASTAILHGGRCCAHQFRCSNSPARRSRFSAISLTSGPVWLCLGGGVSSLLFQQEGSAHDRQTDLPLDEVSSQTPPLWSLNDDPCLFVWRTCSLNPLRRNSDQRS